MEFNLKHLSAEFNIPFISGSLIYKGFDNNVYCLTDASDKKYILRCALRQKNPQDWVFEKNFSLFLSQNNIPVRLLLKAGPVSLLSFCEGKTLTFDEVTPVQCFNAGKSLAQFHLVSKQFKGPPLPKRQLIIELERALRVCDKISKKYSDGLVFVESVKEILNSPWIKTGNNCIIHNDFRIQNVLFYGDQISAVLDFDWACLGNPLKDLAHALVERSILDAHPLRKERLLAFLSGYKSLLPDINYEELQFWICFSCLSDTATYLVDRIDIPQSFGKILSYMYYKYQFFKENNIIKLIQLA